MIDSRFEAELQLHRIQTLMKREKGDYFEEENKILTIASESGIEACQMIEKSTGRKLGIVRGFSDKCSLSEYSKKIKPGEKYINLHNHPNFTAHSIADLYILLTHEEICEIRIISADRTYYAQYDKSIEITKEELDKLAEDTLKELIDKNLSPREKLYKRNLSLGFLFGIIMGEVLI